MGLDMYLKGRKFHWSRNDERRLEDGFEVSETILQLGYWRKHPNLHGYIVQTFADGNDECQEIDLDAEAIQKVIDAIRAKELPKTTGFFFGESDGSEDAESIQTLQTALKWLSQEDKKSSRSVIYRASW